MPSRLLIRLHTKVQVYESRGEYRDTLMCRIKADDAFHIIRNTLPKRYQLTRHERDVKGEYVVDIKVEARALSALRMRRINLQMQKSDLDLSTMVRAEALAFTSDR